MNLYTSVVNEPCRETERVSPTGDLAVWSLVAGIFVAISSIGIATAVFLPGRWLLPAYSLESFRAASGPLFCLNLLAAFVAFWGILFSIYGLVNRSCRRVIAAMGFSLNGTGCLVLYLLLAIMGAMFT